MNPEMKAKIAKIKEMYDDIYNSMNERYTIEKPYLKIVTIRTSTFGEYVPTGYKYSDYKPVVKININSPIEHIAKTIIHELCHSINRTHFWDPHQTKPPRHNKRFWILCKEFGLTPSDYGYGRTKAMKGVYY